MEKPTNHRGRNLSKLLCGVGLAAFYGTGWASPTDWITAPAFNMVVRYYDNNVECASTDARNCTGGVTAEQVRAWPAGTLKPLACGADHAGKWGGSTGYDAPSHWCNDLFGRDYTTWRRATAAGQDLDYGVNPSDDVICLSTDGANCLWDVSNTGNAFAVAVAMLTAKPLACGAMHKAVHGVDGYSVPGHWCARIANARAATTVSTAAGTGSSGHVNGAVSVASFNGPSGVAVDAGGNVYVGDSGNRLIRKIDRAGVVSTLAGSGALGRADGIGPAASFGNPDGVAVDAAGNVYVADGVNNNIRVITPAGAVRTLAGTGATGSSNGPGAAATFSGPHDVAVDARGNVYVSDNGNQMIRKIDTAGMVTTLAGSGRTGRADGPGATASFMYLADIAVDVSGNVYVADQGAGSIRRITPDGVVGTMGAVGVPYPTSVAVDAGGNLYVGGPSPASDPSTLGGFVVNRITPSGAVTRWAGGGNTQSGARDGAGATASFLTIDNLAIGLDGDVYAAGARSHKIRKITPQLP